MIVNSAMRRLDAMFPSYFTKGRKHDHFKDFGWPDHLTFDQLYRMYRRNGLAFAGVDKTILKTWQDSPDIWETEKPAESDVESDIRQRFADLRIWQMFSEADRRSMVGRYAGVILRFADSKQFDQPVDTVPGGILGLAGIIPAWEGQLTVAEWDGNQNSETYGEPLFYQFNESAVGDKTQPRQFRVHPDRVLIWSDDGTVNCQSALEPGYNDLLDAEKVKGAGGEGFWKTSRGAPLIEAREGVDAKTLAGQMGAGTPSEFIDAINEQIDNFQSGFDKGLMLGGMTAKPMQITLPSPEHFFAAPVQAFAASLHIPVKILLGSQTGERASTEDAQEWAQTCNARRVTRNRPIIQEFINRLERFGILPEKDWFIDWADLTEASSTEKMSRAKDMAEINAKHPSEYVFTPDEIREVADYDPLTDDQREMDDLPEDEDVLPQPAAE
ncbi:anti-CBASS protein Acb1 family protein [Devosia honganensis]|uniref:Anti-CBASS protein Acb1 family protein n=1 Tax=Devosia honganensis TaxID=1610527 RepID=A0ABV7WYX7_9HYPH